METKQETDDNNCQIVPKNNCKNYEDIETKDLFEGVRTGDQNITYNHGENKFTLKEIREWKAEMQARNPLLPEEMIDTILDNYCTHPEVLDRLVARDKLKKIEPLVEPENAPTIISVN